MSSKEGRPDEELQRPMKELFASLGQTRENVPVISTSDVDFSSEVNDLWGKAEPALDFSDDFPPSPWDEVDSKLEQQQSVQDTLAVDRASTSAAEDEDEDEQFEDAYGDSIIQDIQDTDATNVPASAQSQQVSGICLVETPTVTSTTTTLSNSTTLVSSSQDATPSRSESVSNSESAASSSQISIQLPLSKSQKISSIQNFMREDQKVAYVCLCLLSLTELRKSKLMAFRKAGREAYDKWQSEFMERLFLYLDVPEKERTMYEQLAEHGLQAVDVSKPLIDDAQATAESMALKEQQKQTDEQSALDRQLPLPDPQPTIDKPADVRYTILSHLFILSISDGIYDARARSLLKTVANHLQVTLLDLVKLETSFATQLRIYEDTSHVKESKETVDDRNKKEARSRWLAAGIATVAGGALIGLTAGLAAPLITASLAGTGVSAFMASTSGLAFITSSGVLAGGGMSGWKMLKRTRGISQFEFISIEDGVRQYIIEREDRRAARAVARSKRVKQKRKSIRPSSDRKAQPSNVEVVFDADEAVDEEEEKSSSSKMTGSNRRYSNVTTSTRRYSNAQSSSSRIITLPDIVASPIIEAPLIELEEPIPDNTFVAPDDDELHDIPLATVSTHRSSMDSDNDSYETASQSSSKPAPSEKGTFVASVSKTLSSLQRQASSTSISGEALLSIEDKEGDMLFRAPTREDRVKQANVLISVVGYIAYGSEDHVLPYSVLEPSHYGDHYALIWETKILQELGASLTLLASEVASFLISQGLQFTILPGLMMALTGPLWVMKLTYLLDNPWGMAMSKASKAGKVLADTLILQVQENRPVTLIGFSLGAHLIYSCLTELASRGVYGVVEDVYILGAPILANNSEWEHVASVVAGKIVNGYLTKDMVLGVLYRALAVYKDVAGLSPIQGVAGIENFCLDDVIDGHLAYRSNLPKILKHIGFNITRETFDDEDEEDKREKEMHLAEIEALKQEQLRAREADLQKREELKQLKKEQAEQKRKEKAEIALILKKQRAFQAEEAKIDKEEARKVREAEAKKLAEAKASAKIAEEAARVAEEARIAAKLKSIVSADGVVSPQLAVLDVEPVEPPQALTTPVIKPRFSVLNMIGKPGSDASTTSGGIKSEVNPQTDIATVESPTIDSSVIPSQSDSIQTVKPRFSILNMASFIRRPTGSRSSSAEEAESPGRNQSLATPPPSPPNTSTSIDTSSSDRNEAVNSIATITPPLRAVTMHEMPDTSRPVTQTAFNESASVNVGDDLKDVVSDADDAISKALADPTISGSIESVEKTNTSTSNKQDISLKLGNLMARWSDAKPNNSLIIDLNEPKTIPAATVPMVQIDTASLTQHIPRIGEHSASSSHLDLTDVEELLHVASPAMVKPPSIFMPSSPRMEDAASPTIEVQEEDDGSASVLYSIPLDEDLNPWN
ncbi:hypothetical protein SmJEL517_g05100 [Synchytrium microbalum]|uniref:DUF726-domain-containing protein n=1 Tax=Synchytrium microbalum TaxID=1806994 RepID=A0A507C246_9FUNG|nr:uncharacterized protein SmJEL517_g05100 [Synchytrium microbalum]TPX31605.1 hypothetical protein SmJEL517_g05100 [Synchytrium microbalum]